MGVLEQNIFFGDCECAAHAVNIRAVVEYRKRLERHSATLLPISQQASRRARADWGLAYREGGMGDAPTLGPLIYFLNFTK